jgi:hypothetical protein
VLASRNFTPDESKRYSSHLARLRPAFHPSPYDETRWCKAIQSPTETVI